MLRRPVHRSSKSSAKISSAGNCVAVGKKVFLVLPCDAPRVCPKVSSRAWVRISASFRFAGAVSTGGENPGFGCGLVFSGVVPLGVCSAFGGLTGRPAGLGCVNLGLGVGGLPSGISKLRPSESGCPPPDT